MRHRLAAIMTILCVAIVLSFTTVSAETPVLSVHFIDVGQGDSILVEAPDHNEMLIDAGEPGAAVADYLKREGVDDLEVVVSTHPHSDHVGGLPEVLDAFRVKQVIDSETPDNTKPKPKQYQTYLARIDTAKIPLKHERNGYEFELAPGVVVYVLGPVLLSSDNPNDRSVVLRITYGKTTYLLMGDAESAEEKSILGTRVTLKADVLKVGHHGSATSTSQKLLDAARPKYAVISCGVNNQYSHPEPKILARLVGMGAEIHRTDLEGTIVSVSDGEKVTISAEGKTGLAAGGLPAVSSKPAEGQSIGNINTKKFHRPTCSYLPEPQNRIYFKTRGEAVAAGYVPCKKCKP